MIFENLNFKENFYCEFHGELNINFYENFENQSNTIKKNITTGVALIDEKTEITIDTLINSKDCCYLDFSNFIINNMKYKHISTKIIFDKQKMNKVHCKK